MADVEVSYENQVIKSLSASGQLVCHTAGKYCDDDITIDYTAPGGSALLASGTFVGSGPGEQLINIGTKLPLRNFVISIVADGVDDFVYNGDYKNMVFASVVDGQKYEMYMQSQQADYDNYRTRSVLTYYVNNNGNRTQIIASSVPSEVITIRNNIIAANGLTIGYDDTFSFRKYSDHVMFRYRASSNAVQYYFPTQNTYNWAIYYYGTNPVTDIIEV